MKEIIAEIEELITHYRNAKLYGEVFGLKEAQEIVIRHDKDRVQEEEV